MTRRGSLLAGIPAELPEEIFDTLCSTEQTRIERIVSRAHASPEGFWYDQDHSEFVLVVRGTAGLRMEGQEDVVVLRAGDWLDIAANARHRVEWTDPEDYTVWLAVHY